MTRTEVEPRGQIQVGPWIGQIGTGSELVNPYYYRVRFGCSTWSEWNRVPLPIDVGLYDCMPAYRGSGPGHLPMYSDARKWLEDMMEKHASGTRFM